MKEEHGLDVFFDGCPVCKELCCCNNKSVYCHRKNHCYRKCPATKTSGKHANLRAFLNADKEESDTDRYAHKVAGGGSSSTIGESSSSTAGGADSAAPNGGIFDLLAAVADMDRKTPLARTETSNMVTGALDPSKVGGPTLVSLSGLGSGVSNNSSSSGLLDGVSLSMPLLSVPDSNPTSGFSSSSSSAGPSKKKTKIEKDAPSTVVGGAGGSRAAPGGVGVGGFYPGMAGMAGMAVPPGATGGSSDPLSLSLSLTSPAYMQYAMGGLSAGANGMGMGMMLPPTSSKDLLYNQIAGSNPRYLSQQQQQLQMQGGDGGQKAGGTNGTASASAGAAAATTASGGRNDSVSGSGVDGFTFNNNTLGVVRGSAAAASLGSSIDTLALMGQHQQLQQQHQQTMLVQGRLQGVPVGQSSLLSSSGAAGAASGNGNGNGNAKNDAVSSIYSRLPSIDSNPFAMAGGGVKGGFHQPTAPTAPSVAMDPSLQASFRNLAAPTISPATAAVSAAAANGVNSAAKVLAALSPTSTGAVAPAPAPTPALAPTPVPAVTTAATNFDIASTKENTPAVRLSAPPASASVAAAAAAAAVESVAGTGAGDVRADGEGQGQGEGEGQGEGGGERTPDSEITAASIAREITAAATEAGNTSGALGPINLLALVSSFSHTLDNKPRSRSNSCYSAGTAASAASALSAPSPVTAGAVSAAASATAANTAANAGSRPPQQ
jgi:trimeric autotransporter adhesin